MSVFRTFTDAADERAPATAGPALPWAVPARGDRRWVRWLCVAIVPLAIVYLSMLNRYWVPSGDGEVYTCIARSLVQGEGLTFNGSRAAIAPPGWPIVLSLAMRVSPEFAFLKLVTIACMLGAMVPAFFTLRRFASDRVAALTILLTGTLSTLYPLTFWLHTEAFFCLLGFGAILVAFRIAERRAWPTLEVPAMLALLGLGAFTRWPGVLHLALVVPILLSGPRRPWARPTRWATVALACLVGVGTFYETRAYLSLTPAEKRHAVNSGATADAGDVDAPAAAAPVAAINPNGDDDRVPEANTFDKSHGRRGRVAEIAYRVGVAGKWFAWLLWQPTRFGASINAIDLLALSGGWLSIGLLACAMVAALPRRNYFWAGLALYTGGLCVLWPNPNARYFIPVAPFIVLGVILGIAELGAWLDTLKVRREDARTAVPIDAVDPRTRHLHLLGGWRILAIVFVVTLLLNNLPLLAIDVSVFRSGDFYGRYEAGANKELIAVAQYIVAKPQPLGTQIVVSERYDNMGRTRWSKFAMRALHLLTDQPIVGMDHSARLSNRPGGDASIRRWLRNRANAEYYVYQTGWNPWRVWHLRLSRAWQTTLTRRPPSTMPASGGWELYERVGMLFPRQSIDVAATFAPPTRVPGVDRRTPHPSATQPTTRRARATTSTAPTTATTTAPATTAPVDAS